MRTTLRVLGAGMLCAGVLYIGLLLGALTAGANGPGYVVALLAIAFTICLGFLLVRRT